MVAKSKMCHGRKTRLSWIKNWPDILLAPELRIFLPVGLKLPRLSAMHILVPCTKRIRLTRCTPITRSVRRPMCVGPGQACFFGLERFFPFPLPAALIRYHRFFRDAEHLSHCGVHAFSVGVTGNGCRWKRLHLLATLSAVLVAMGPGMVPARAHDTEAGTASATPIKHPATK